MTWRVTFESRSYLSDDLTLGEVEQVERWADEPWSTLNPFRTVKAAMAFLAVFRLRDGDEPAKVSAWLDGLTLKQIKGAFDHVDDEPAPEIRGEETDPVPLSSAPSPGDSSPGAPPDSAGRPGSPGLNGSET